MKAVNPPEKVVVKILDLPGESGPCPCLLPTGGPEYLAFVQQKVASLQAALEKAYPGRTRVEYLNLQENPAAQASPEAQLLLSKQFCALLVIINSEPRYGGIILVQKIVKDVGRLLDRREKGARPEPGGKDIKEVIKDRYGRIARGEATACCPTCGPTPFSQCLVVGYSPEDLALVPEQAILGVGCGNPASLAELKEGETVLDLGSGAGIDAFLAAKKVGERGRVIGVDMTKDMVARGKQLAREHGYDNVEFRQGDIERLPVDTATIDVILSNCVINLTQDKLASFREAYRVLKPGGRLLVADLVTSGSLPDDVRQSAAAWADCLAGAMEKEAYLETIRHAGFDVVEVVSQASYEAPGMDERLRGTIISVKVRAFKAQ